MAQALIDPTSAPGEQVLVEIAPPADEPAPLEPFAPPGRHLDYRAVEERLVAAVRRGDDRAFEQLFSRYRGRIAGYIAGMVGDHARAEDLTQEVFISALRRLRDTERPIAFKPWIYEIAKNACIDEYRRSRRKHEVSLDTDDDEPGRERNLPSREPTPDAAVESKQRLADLRGAFHGLSEHHHRILVMRELEGLSYSEIGKQLGMSRPMVESTLFRARRRLSEEYQELVSGRRCARIQAAIEAGEARSLRALGIRERRQFARHLSHCQPCRREARMAGVDEALLRAPSVLGKIAAILPIPWLRWRRGGGKPVGSSSHSISIPQSLQNMASFTDQFVQSVGAGRAAVAAAALLMAGAGGGIVTGLASHPARAAGGTPAAVHNAHTARAASGSAPPGAGGLRGGGGLRQPPGGAGGSHGSHSGSSGGGANAAGGGGGGNAAGAGRSGSGGGSSSGGGASTGTSGSSGAVNVNGVTGSSPLNGSQVINHEGAPQLPAGGSGSGIPLPKLPGLSGGAGTPTVPSLPKLPLNPPSGSPGSVPSTSSSSGSSSNGSGLIGQVRQRLLPGGTP